MLDPKLLRNNLDQFAEQLARRGFTLDTQKLIDLESERKVLQVKTQELQAERKSKSKEIGIAKKNGQDASDIFTAVAQMADELKTAEARLKVLLDETNALLMTIPIIVTSCNITKIINRGYSCTPCPLNIYCSCRSKFGYISRNRFLN